MKKSKHKVVYTARSFDKRLWTCNREYGVANFDLTRENGRIYTIYNNRDFRSSRMVLEAKTS
jgi:hypothetical protein